jgi:hypothetical protein
MLSNELTYRTITAEFERSSSMFPNSWSRLYAVRKYIVFYFSLTNISDFLREEIKQNPSEKRKIDKGVPYFHFILPFCASSCTY